MQVAKENQSSLFILSLILLLASCQPAAVYDEFKPVGGQWHLDSMKTFEVTISDTSVPYAVIMKLRHNADYPYANLYLFRTISSANGIEYADTVNLALANQQGKWLGSGIGEVKTMEWIYADRGLQFTDQRKYTFTLQHGMRDTLLNGIMDVGLELRPIIDQTESEK